MNLIEIKLKFNNYCFHIILKKLPQKELFKSHYLNLTSYMISDTGAMPVDTHRLIVQKNDVRRERDNRYFFVGKNNKKCRVIFLYKYLSYQNEYFLLFNSDLYAQEHHSTIANDSTTMMPCFYRERSTETFYTTVSFCI